MPHRYLSTSCWHHRHDYCASSTAEDTAGEPFTRNPATCKFCHAPCECWCHRA